MTKIEVTGKVIPSGVLDKKFVQGENKMEKILFALPLNYGGVDMAAMNYTLRLANVAGTVTGAALVKTVADKVTLEWTVTEDFVRMPGNCRIELDGVDAEGAHKFLAVSAWFDVLKNLGQGSNLPPKDEITAALESMQVYVSGAAASAEEAKRWAEQSAAASAEIEQQLQDAAEVTQELTDKTTAAQEVAGELGEMLAEADLSGYVSKAGTSVVTGDLQVPAPATEGSAVNRGYADGNGYEQALKDGMNTNVPLAIYKHMVTLNPYVYVMSDNAVAHNNKYNQVCILGKSNFAIEIQGFTGRADNVFPIRIFIQQKSNNNITVRNLGYTSISDLISIVVSKDENQAYLYIKKGNFNYAHAMLRFIIHEGLNSIQFSDGIVWADSPIGDVVATIDNNTPSELKSYADSVPYQYAKAAGFPFNEDIFKKNISSEPFVISKWFNGAADAGYIKIAESSKTVNSSSASAVLVVEGSVRSWPSTDSFVLHINNRPADNPVTFEGYGNGNGSSVYNLLLYKNANDKYELYFQSTVTSSGVGNVSLRIHEDNPTHDWIINNDSFDLASLTSGTIPGTKVWDLKTAWGTTSRTQITKEEIKAGGEINNNLTINQGGTTGTKGLYLKFDDSFTATVRATKGANGTVNIVSIGEITSSAFIDVIIAGVKTPYAGNQAANKDYVDNAIAALEAKLTGKTVSEVLAANSIAASIPAAAPSLEISEEEEEITV